MAMTDMTARYQAARDRLMERRLAQRQENDRRREEADRAAREEKARKLEIAAQRERDKLLAKIDSGKMSQQAAYAADAALAQFNYHNELQKQEIKAQKSRDKLQQRFEVLQGRRQRSDQAARDQRLFEQSQQEDATQFRNQLQRDAIQQGYSQQNDRLQNDATLRRDAMQAGYGMLENRQQQQFNLSRDAMQAQQQKQRDELLNRFDQQRSRQQFDQQLQRDSLQEKYSQEAAQQQFRNQMQRDWTQNQFSTEADYRQQGFNEQNMYQREAADISARWQEQVSQARNAGLDFSERQRRQMQEMDASFRKNVLNGPYDDVLKQRASVEHAKKLSAIVPEERVQSPQDQLEQSLVYNPMTGQQMMGVRDPHGFMRFEPLDDGSSAFEAQRQRQEQLQQQAEQKRQEAIQNASFERMDKYNTLVEKIRGESDPSSAVDAPMYKTEQAVQEEALRRFQKYDELYQQHYGLEPFSPYGQQANQQQASAQNSPMPQGVQNPQSGVFGGGRTAGGGASGSWGNPKPAQELPVILFTQPLPTQIVDRLKNVNGGDQLVQLREKHSSNSVKDQTVKEAADIVIRAVTSGDTSDPDLAEALDILKEAGFKIGP